jgi:lipopolysaccharide transport system ATP-binding protein
MSSPVVISVENLGKRYRLNRRSQRQSYVALRDVISEKFRGLTRPRKQIETSSTWEDFWALQDVSFSVREGEVIGVIGRNGAGKSTLLKVLSRITEPNRGKVRIRGRVASLLEVGTGFHPELTGRENIYLNGAILGMRRTEIRAKFDEIVAFAEVEKFLDTPVKRYSSGMYVRLAFAVAAHLEPEILIVDEVLAVGDAQFQKKCLGKMQDVARGGRTVLFVSHQMSAIQNLCARAIFLQTGNVVLDGDVHAVVKAYLQEGVASDRFVREGKVDTASGPKITAATLLTNEGVQKEQPDESLLLHVCIESSQARRVSLELRWYNALGSVIGFGSLGTLSDREMLDLHVGMNEITVAFSTQSMANGSYGLGLSLAVPFVEFLDRVENCLSFDLARSASGIGTRVLEQQWGAGSHQMTVQLIKKT